MAILNSLLALLDSRSFSTVWYWILLFGLWSVAGRRVIGVPVEILSRARGALRSGRAESPEVMSLLDWLSLTLPRLQLGRTEGAVFLAISGFGLSSLAILGFFYLLEAAQALTLLLLPFFLLFWMRIYLVRRLTPLMEQAETGAIPVSHLARQAVQQMTWHRRFISLLSIVSMTATAFWGTIWMIRHPFGI